MNLSKNNFVIILILYGMLFSGSTNSQTYTKITDPVNPVVNEMLESGGGFWVDLNNDGWLDLFVANGNLTSQNNSLFINNRNGGFIKVQSGPVVTDGGSSIGGAFADYNNDGKSDLFVTNRNFFKNFLYTGNGDSSFTKIMTGSIVNDSANSNSGHWLDIDRDGDLDLFIVNFQGNDFLYLNNGQPAFDFTKIDTASFLLDGNAFSINAVWSDFNNDRLPDLFIGNAGNQNDNLFRNNGNLTFNKTVIADGKSTLGGSWGDYNNDGNQDLFAANFLDQNNILYRNSGPPLYELTALNTGIVSNDGGSSVGSCWGDIDNDGDLDIFVCNDDLQNNFLYLNNGAPDYDFTKISAGSVVNDGGNSFGCVFGDYNNDGALDLFVANRLNQKNFLYVNNSNSNNWIGIKCNGVISSKSAIGTKVRIKALINGLPVWQLREIQSQSGYNSGNLILNFGLGNAAFIDSMKIEWLSGTTSVFTNLQVNRYITASEDGNITSVKDQSINPDFFELKQNYPNPFNPTTIITYQCLSVSNVSLKVYNVLGNELTTLVNETQSAGSYSVTFDGSNFPSGVFFYKLQAGESAETKRMVLLK